LTPAIGGTDKGPALAGSWLEKDITLRLARDLRKELEEAWNRGAIAARVGC